MADAPQLSGRFALPLENKCARRNSNGRPVQVERLARPEGVFGSSGRSSSLTPLPASRLVAGPSYPLEEAGIVFQLVVEPIVFRSEPPRTPAGFPCRVMTISSFSARRRYFDRSSLISDRATFFIAFTMFRKPGVRPGLRHDRPKLGPPFQSRGRPNPRNRLSRGRSAVAIGRAGLSAARPMLARPARRKAGGRRGARPA